MDLSSMRPLPICIGSNENASWQVHLNTTRGARRKIVHSTARINTRPEVPTRRPYLSACHKGQSPQRVSDYPNIDWSRIARVQGLATTCARFALERLL